jgi:hypothetical protein
MNSVNHVPNSTALNKNHTSFLKKLNLFKIESLLHCRPLATLNHAVAQLYLPTRFGLTAPTGQKDLSSLSAEEKSIRPKPVYDQTEVFLTR